MDGGGGGKGMREIREGRWEGEGERERERGREGGNEREYSLHLSSSTPSTTGAETSHWTLGTLP